MKTFIKRLQSLHYVSIAMGAIMASACGGLTNGVMEPRADLLPEVNISHGSDVVVPLITVSSVNTYGIPTSTILERIFDMSTHTSRAPSITEVGLRERHRSDADRPSTGEVNALSGPQILLWVPGVATQYINYSDEGAPQNNQENEQGPCQRNAQASYDQYYINSTKHELTNFR